MISKGHILMQRHHENVKARARKVVVGVEFML